MRGPESPLLLLWRLHPPPCGLHVRPPPLDTLVVVRLQAERMACSWLSSTWKSCGGLYGFFSVMMRPSLLVDSSQGVNQRLTDGMLRANLCDITRIGDGGFCDALFPSGIGRLFLAKAMNGTGTAGAIAQITHRPYGSEHLCHCIL